MPTWDNATKSAAAVAIIGQIDDGGAAGSIEIAAAGDTAFATVLVSYTLNFPVGTETNGVITFSGFSKSSNGLNTGTAGLYRILDSNSVERMRGTVTLSGGGGEIIADDLSVTSGAPWIINSFVVTALPDT